MITLGRAGRLRQYDNVPRVQFLVLHHVFDDERQNFERQVQALAEHFEFVSYSEAVHCVHSRRADGPKLAFSFDDGFKNCLVAAEILERYGVSACFFVCPNLVGERDHSRLATICRKRWGMPPTELLSWDDLEDLVARGHELGGHTMVHPYMQRLRLNEAELEIGACRAVLLQRFGIANHFAWPYGGFDHMRPEIAAAVFDGGFVSCASGRRGAHQADRLPDGEATPVCIRRDSVMASWPWRHVDYFLAKNAIEPLSPAATWPNDWIIASENRQAA